MPENGNERRVRRDKTPEEALARLMALAARGERSSGDAMRLMRGWGIEPEQREKILARLIDGRFIDDSRYCEAFVREKLRFSGWGEYKIRAALAAKGIRRELIDRALDLHASRDDMRSRLAKCLRAKASKFTGLTPYELRAKLMRYGASLGYDYETVAEEVDKLGRKPE